ncbi:ABC transporter ATP-binding protein [Rothia sp. P6271]|uniref:ABC transporter ATP-binding protein n=1 Tax=unclassified Rothia (in: high G+C Gram-positive bacteria) TaxID=2689056 RepID=UPI003AC54C61
MNSTTDLSELVFGTKTPNVLVNNVSLDYVVSSGRSRITQPAPKKIVHALQPLSFVAHEGEFIGIVGRNGSGKSSLLRLIAGLETPTSGEVYASSPPSLIGVHGVLNNDLSGEENIELGCLAMGLTPAELPDAKTQIMELAGIGEAINRPMRTYSSGMAARLRFAIMLANRPRITLIDEALSTGDASFADRSAQAMKELLDQAGTVFLVSHAAQTIENMCTRAIWLDFGELVMDGDAREVARKYRWFAHNIAQGDERKAARLLYDAKELGREGYVKNSE